MKIITWNCCLKLSSKFEIIKKLHADILIIQECEKLPKDYFSGAEYHWIGHQDNKGIGVLLFNSKAEIDKSFNDKLDYFLPLNLGNGIKLLATWSFTHRAAGRFGDGHLGHVSDALSYYKDWLKETDQGIIAGDFNNSIIWDKGNKESNFLNTNSRLNSLGYQSVYHQLSGEDFGAETAATLYHTKKKDKIYHIDYIYLKGIKPISADVGIYEDWIKLSDHMPLSITTDTDNIY
jgi:exonuclease III